MDIRKTIMELANEAKTFKTSDVVKKSGGNISRQYVSAVIRQMVREGMLLKGGSTASAFYALPKNSDSIVETINLRFDRAKIEEHAVFDTLRNRYNFVRGLPDNVQSILFYAFTEMLNNAIEHSKSEHIEIELRKDRTSLTFVINDFGIGVFKNVMKQRHLKSEIEAMQDLLKGKTTTQPHSHSGEGIFFTSKIADLFQLESFEYRLRIDNNIRDTFFEELKPSKNGTRVIFNIAINSKKHLSDVFNKFVTNPGEPGFNKTEILVRLFTQGTIYISRSQARRILHGLDKYESIVLDYDKVSTVGQAFADEIYRVFKTSHPDIKIESVNTIEPVKFMIDRAEDSKFKIS
jgi:anti-sigma regulatory factor (Ser/Thr protein kinase)